MYLYPLFLFRQRRETILSVGVKYTLYLIEKEFNHSKNIFVISFTTSLRDALSSSKRWRMHKLILQLINQGNSIKNKHGFEDDN